MVTSGFAPPEELQLLAGGSNSRRARGAGLWSGNGRKQRFLSELFKCCTETASLLLLRIFSRVWQYLPLYFAITQLAINGQSTVAMLVSV